MAEATVYVPDPKEPTYYDADLPGGDLGSGGSGSSGTGGTGTGDLQVFMDRAPADPDNISIGAVSYSSSDGSLQHWDINTLSWI